MSLYDSILITGGRGMLAHAFAEVLRARGLRAEAVGREVCDVTNPLSVAMTFEKVRPTLVLNCAAYTKVDAAERERKQANAVNAIGPANLAAQCRHSGATLVHFSTDYVFGGSHDRPLRADDRTNPQSAYGQSKLLGEQNIRARPPARWLIIRTAWLYGPGGPCFPQTMLTLARQGAPLRVVADQIGSPTYTFDLAAATLDLLDRNATGVWHLTNAGQTNWAEFAVAILKAFDVKTQVIPITSEEWKQSRPSSAPRPAYSVLDTTPFDELVGRPMRTWQEALLEFAVGSRQ